MSQQHVEIVRRLAAALQRREYRGDAPVARPDVVVNILIHGRGTASGAEFDLSVWWAFTLRDGKVVRCFSYLDRERALEAVGLRE